MLDYARQAQSGRMHWSQVSGDIQYPEHPTDPNEVLSNVTTAKDASAALDSYNPPQKLYRELKAKLAELRGQGDGPVTQIADGPTLKFAAAKGKKQPEVVMEDPRVPELRAQEGVVLGFVIVGRRRLAVRDVIRNLIGPETMDEREIGEVVRAVRYGDADELIRVAAAVMRRIEVGRIERAIRLFVPEREVDAAAAAQWCVIAQGLIDIAIRSVAYAAVESGRTRAGARGDVEHGAEAQTVLRRVRALDRVEIGDVVRIDLAADFPVERLR